MGLRVLIACEFSGVVRRAFRALGHDAYSCDLLPAEDKNFYHFRADVRNYLKGTPKEEGWSDQLGGYSWGGDKWDLMIAHPPCTHLAVSGARWFKDKQKEQAAALQFVQTLLDAPIPHIALENPISIISSRIRKPDQIIQPFMFGHTERKPTCLWLKNLPNLASTKDVYAEMMTLPKRERERIHYMPPGPNRWKERSRTYEGIAAAMAEQWSAHILQSMRQAA
jgi:site-specific DNA-cytosine methylase